MSARLGPFIAEAIGTFCLVFFGCSAIIVSQMYPGTLDHAGVAMAFGLIVMTMIYSVGNISGAHLNPAVTVGFVMARRLDRSQLLPYLLSQLIGALLAAGLLRALFPEHNTLGATLPAIGLPQALLLEVLLTFMLMFIILNVSTGHMEKGIMAGVAVGGYVALAALVGGPLTGASMNPARSLGPALFSGEIHSLWLYLFAPVVGAVLAYPTCRWIQGDECCQNPDVSEAA